MKNKTLFSLLYVLTWFFIMLGIIIIAFEWMVSTSPAWVKLIITALWIFNISMWSHTGIQVRTMKEYKKWPLYLPYYFLNVVSQVSRLAWSHIANFFKSVRWVMRRTPVYWNLSFVSFAAAEATLKENSKAKAMNVIYNEKRDEIVRKLAEASNELDKIEKTKEK